MRDLIIRNDGGIKAIFFVYKDSVTVNVWEPTLCDWIKGVMSRSELARTILVNRKHLMLTMATDKIEFRVKSSITIDS